MSVHDGPEYAAATARRHRLTLVTGNDRDFRRPGLKVFNPFKELPRAKPTDIARLIRGARTQRAV
jgi:hypothetical protein